MGAFPITFVWLLGGNALNMFARSSPRPTRHDIPAIIREAVTDRPLSLMPLGFIWALDQLLYFFALSNLGAVTYTVLAQTKIFFTVAFLRSQGLVGSSVESSKPAL